MTRFNRPLWRSLIAGLLLCTWLAAPAAADDLSFGAGLVLSPDDTVAGAAFPGGAASKGKLLRLTKTPMATHDGRLVMVYADANNLDYVWTPKSGLHHPKDIFARFSDDQGATWSNPVNLSNTARHWSALTDWDGDNFDEIAWGDSEKPNVFSSGDVVVVSWVDTYMPLPGWTWGEHNVNPVQGTVHYPDIDVYPNQREVPYHGTYLAISKDGGQTWVYGDQNPPLQLTYGRRDAKQDVHRGAGKRWVVTWQEDPEGLQTGSAEGPGDGASGANTTKGTDIWYTWTEDIVANPTALQLNRTPLTGNSTYDMTAADGFPTVEVGLARHGASRANLFLVNDAGAFTALVACEETKGVQDILEGKTVQFLSFPFNQPMMLGPDNARHGDCGTTLTSELKNARRVRFVAQPPDGINPALAMFWREGVATEGGPADIMLRVSRTLDPADLMAGPALNMSTNSPTASGADLLLDTEANPIEDARAHRAVLRGDMLIIGYTYTWNGPLARYTDLANYDFWIRRSTDGGLTWSDPQNLSNLPDTLSNVKEPRLVAPSKTGVHDEAAFIAAWGTETNVYDGVESPTPLDIMITRTFDQGATFDPVVPVSMSPAMEYESQLRVLDDVTKVGAVWMSNDGLATDVLFGWSSPWQELGFADPGALGPARLTAEGPFTAGSSNGLRLENGPTLAPFALFFSETITPTPFKGGVLLAQPTLAVLNGLTDDLGAVDLAFTWPAVAPAELSLVAHMALADPTAMEGVALSTGVKGTSR